MGLVNGLRGNLSRLKWCRSLHSTAVQQKKRRTLSYVHTSSDVPFLSKTMGQVVDEQAEVHCDEEAFILPFQNIRKTFAEFKEDVDAFGSGLLALGLQRGDRVGMWGTNSYQWLLTQFATAKAGLVMVCVNPGYKANELAFCLETAQIKVLIASEENYTSKSLATLEQISPDLLSLKQKGFNRRVPDLSHVILISDEEYPGLHRFKDIPSMSNRESLLHLEKQARGVQLDHAVNIQFTSGTTGNPKGATLTHHNILNNAYFFGRRLDLKAKATKLCSPVSLYHCFGCVLASLTSIVHGISMVIPEPRFNAELTLKAIDAEKCTVIYGVPTMYTDLINHPKFSQYNTRTLKMGFMSGAPCSVELITQVKRRMGMDDIIVGYGMTETSPLISVSFLGDSNERTSQTVGTALDHTEIKIVSPEDEVVPLGVRGEVQARGYSTMTGYWGDDCKTKEFFSPTKWAKTGDVGVMDEEGYIKIVGRNKDVIIRGGENVYPAEVENRLLQHPAVAEAYVVGVPDKRLVEEVCCWCKLKSPVTEKDLRAFCQLELARYKVPKYFVILDPSESFPLTVSGKVQKFKMREQSIKRLNLGDIPDVFQSTG